MSGIELESLKTNFKIDLVGCPYLTDSVQSFVFLFATFPDIHLFLINCNLF